MEQQNMTAVEWLVYELDRCGYFEINDRFPITFEQAIKMEKDQKKHWHSENPNKDGEYICRMDNGYIKMCHYVNGVWYDMWDTGIKGTVKEWMNIPYDNF